MGNEIRQLLLDQCFEAAMEALLAQYQKPVFRMAVAMLHDTGRAEEATQDVFLKVWKSIRSYDARAAPSTWLYTIARNTFLTAVRHESRRKTVPIGDIPEPVACARPGLDTDLAQCLARLPDTLRTIVTLFYLEERSVRTIAAMLNLPEGTVKSHLHRARRALGEMME